MERLTTVALTPTPLVKTFTYNAIGNLTSKWDVGTYSYPASGQPRPHAVTSISGGAINTTFTYDAKGNMTAGNGLTVAYASYDKPSSITRGSNTLTFSHDPEHQRFKQVGPSGTTLYLAASGVLAEKFTGLGGAVTWTNYLVSSAGMVGVHVELPDESTLTRYLHKDHLGSIATITNEAGVVLERLSYDAWGKRRLPNGEDDTAGAITSESKRGFTGHEQLDDVGLVHMNGRVYDPLLARFGTPDPVTEAPFTTQGWNRYAYVGNSPLNFTDPSGYCFMGCFFQKIGKAIQNVFRSMPIVGSILRIAATAACVASMVCAPFAPLVAGLTSAFVAGVTSGNLGVALRAGVVAFATTIAFQAVGGLTKGLYFEKIAAHAAVGCVSAVASGGKCGPGAASAAVSAAGTPLIGAYFDDPLGNAGHFVGGTTATALLGGLGSVAAGDKFANGAVTGAFGYLFNYLSELHRQITVEAAKGLMDYLRARQLGVAVARVDFLPGSFDPENAHWHGMCTAGDAADVCSGKTAAYREQVWNMKSLEGLARLLHLEQDSFAPGHIGGQPWGGCYTCDIPGMLRHYNGDAVISLRMFDFLRERTRELIIEYDKHCKGCILNPPDK